MQNGETDPEILLERLRGEVRKRKLALETETRDRVEPEPAMPTATNHSAEPEPAGLAATNHSAEVAVPSEVPSSAEPEPAGLAATNHSPEVAVPSEVPPPAEPEPAWLAATNHSAEVAASSEAPPPAEPEPAWLAAANNSSEVASLLPTTTAQVLGKPRLKQAQVALVRAVMKNESVRGWPRFLRGIRRNQDAINESLIRAVRPLLGTVEWLRKRFALFETEQREQQNRLIRIDQRIEEQSALVEGLRKQNVRLDELVERDAHYRKEISELTSRLIDYHDKSSARLGEIGQKQGEHGEKLADLWKFAHAQQEQTVAEQWQFEEQQRRIHELSLRLVGYREESHSREQMVGEEQQQHGRQLADLQKFADAQQKQTAEEQRQFEEQHKQLRELRENVGLSAADTAERRRHIEELQRQLIDLNYKLIDYQNDIGGRFERTADRQQHEQLGQEIRTFITAQEAQTLEEQRQFEEQRKQLSDVNAKLVEYQYHAGARTRLFAEQQEHDRTRLIEMQAFIRAQEEHNAEKNRLLQEQQQQMSELRSKVAGQQEESGIQVEKIGKKQEQQEQELADLQTFVSEQQEQTAEEHRQLAAQREHLANIGAQLVEYQNDVCARYHLTAEQQEQEQRLLEEMQAFIREQEKQTVEEQRHLQQVQDFIKAQEADNSEKSRLLHGQQQQISELSSKVTGQQEKSGIWLERVGEKQQQQERQLIDVQQFVSEQQERTAEEQRQLAEQWKQVTEINAKLIEYQNDACARYHLTTEQQEREKQQLEEMRVFISEQEKQTVEEQRQLQQQQEQLAEVRARVEEYESSAHPHGEIEAVRDRVNALQGSFSILQAHLAKRKSRPLSPTAARSLNEDLKQHEADAFYLSFENQFRGAREEIKDRLRFYLPGIEQTKNATGNGSALDVGCGRGEWLELLREHGYDGRGVDLNICMVEECTSRGLTADCRDAIEYLRELPSGSLSLVTGFHIVEHLPFIQLLDLFRESHRVLRVHGTAIFETPNPECQKVPTYSFFLDPTHRNPIPQELLSFAARYAGFETTRIERLQPYYEEGVFKGHLDYSGIFTK
jgi:SAM-dependent methyltransferase